MSGSKKYRLRKGNKIVGYAQETKHGLFIKGKGLLWFMTKVNYDNIDECVGIKDKLNREVYELDMVRYKLNKGYPESEGVILWEQERKEFILFDIKNYTVIPIFIQGINIFSNDPLEVTSHLFNHPKLIKILKLSLD